jgi:hypothetical protein
MRMIRPLAVLAIALLLAASASAASFDAVRFAHDAQADLNSAKARKSGIFGGSCKVLTRSRVRCVVISPAYTRYTGGGPRFRVDFWFSKGLLRRTAYTSDGIRIGPPTTCRYLTYAGWSRHCDT